MRQGIAKRPIKTAVTVLTLAFLASCAISPKPTTHTERKARAQKDWHEAFKSQESITKPISQYTAMARAVKYNLDLRLKAMESAMGKSYLNISRFNMLPNIVTRVGLDHRSNLYGSSSRSLIPGIAPAPPSTSIDRSRTIADLQLSYNILDFGVSYISAKQAANDYLITMNRRQKMLQNIIRDTRYAYWRALSAQVLLYRINPFINEIQHAVKTSKIIADKKLNSPLDELMYRKTLLETLRQMTTLRRDLNHAKVELSGLMNLRPGTKFKLIRPLHETIPLPKKFPNSITTLEKIALLQRPELQEEDYRTRISLDEIDKERLRMLPGIELGVGYNYDSNSFLVNNNWANGSAFLMWNLMKIVKGPAAIKHAKNNLKVAHVRRKALGMAIVTQVDIAKLRYLQTLRELNVARDLRKIDTQIHKVLSNKAKSQQASKLKVINAKANMILSQLRYELAYVEWQNAGGQLLNAVGYDPLHRVKSINQPIATLAKQIRESLKHMPYIKVALPSQITNKKKLAAHPPKMNKA